MKREDIALGDILYRADVIDPPDGKERIFVRKFEVTMCGEQKFQVRSERWTEQGFWGSHPDLISSLQRTPEQAVEHLSRVTELGLTKAKEKLVRQEKRAAEVRRLIAEWRNKAGL